MRPLQQSGSLKILKTCSVKTLKTCSVKNIKSCVPQQRVCYNWHLKELPFFNTSDILKENITTPVRSYRTTATVTLWERIKTILSLYI